MPKEKTNYTFERRIAYEIKDGYYLQEPTTNTDTGMLFDKEFNHLKHGKKLHRTVTETRDHTIHTRQQRPIGENVYQRLYRIEGTGLIKDDLAFPNYPFNPDTNIEIRIRHITPELIIINIKEV